MVLAFARTSPPSFSPRALGGAARGLPIHAIATPQPAIAQLLSTCAASENSLMAASSQNECSMATPRRKCTWAAGVHDVWKLTLPSCSVAAPVTWDSATDAGRNRATTSVTMRGIRFMAGPPCAGESTIRQPCSGSAGLAAQYPAGSGGSAASVADVRLLGVAQLGERFAQRRVVEQRVVAEAAHASRLAGDPAFGHAFHD